MTEGKTSVAFDRPALPSDDRGRCTESVSGIGSVTLDCVLLAGHDGQHHDRGGADWQKRRTDLCICGHDPRHHRDPEWYSSDRRIPCGWRGCGCPHLVPDQP